MRVSKRDLKAIVAFIDAEDGEDRSWARLDLQRLRDRLNSPDGPFRLKKRRDRRDHRVWEIVSDEYLDLPEEFERWYYEKDDAKDDLARLNIQHENGQREKRVEEEQQKRQHRRAAHSGWDAVRRGARSIPTMTPEDEAEAEDLARKVTGA